MLGQSWNWMKFKINDSWIWSSVVHVHDMMIDVTWSWLIRNINFYSVMKWTKAPSESSKSHFHLSTTERYIGSLILSGLIMNRASIELKIEQLLILKLIEIRIQSDINFRTKYQYVTSSTSLLNEYSGQNRKRILSDLTSGVRRTRSIRVGHSNLRNYDRINSGIE